MLKLAGGMILLGESAGGRSMMEESEIVEVDSVSEAKPLSASSSGESFRSKTSILLPVPTGEYVVW